MKLYALIMCPGCAWASYTSPLPYHRHRQKRHHVVTTAIATVRNDTVRNATAIPAFCTFSQKISLKREDGTRGLDIKFRPHHVYNISNFCGNQSLRHNKESIFLSFILILLTILIFIFIHLLIITF